MRETKYYKVAEVLFSVSAENDDFALMTNYEPFVCADGSKDSPVFQLTVEEGDAVAFTEEMRQDDEGQEIICGKTADGSPVFQFIWANATAGWLVCENNYSKAKLVVTGRYRKLALDNALMILFALSTADKGVALFHSSTVSFGDKAYMFLGVSGTGKSTHTGNWLKYIPGTDLMNDDNPVVRFIDGQAIVFGSPWSGKTPCYRNVEAPIGAFVQLKQAPENKIRRQSVIEAFASLLPSCSVMKWD